MALTKFWDRNKPDGATGTGGGLLQRRKAPPPTRTELLALRPMRNPALEWEEQDGHVVLHIKHRPSQTARLLSIIFPLPRDRHVQLDSIGTDVWQMLDGKTSIGRIAKALAQKYKITPREAELSLQQFFKDLGRRGYIGFRVDQPPGEPTDKTGPGAKAKAKRRSR